MKFFLFVVLFFASQYCFSQSIIFTTLRANDIKLGFSIDSVNKYLDEPIKLHSSKKYDDYALDTFNVRYKNTSLKLVFGDFFEKENNIQVRKTELVSIYCSNNSIQTKSGIKVGDDKYDIIKKIDKNFLALNPECDLGKDFSTVELYDENEHRMTMYFQNNKLHSIRIDTGIVEGC